MPELVYIGTIRTPHKNLEACPRNVSLDGPPATLEVKKEYAEALMGLERHEYIQVLYWLDRAQRGLLVQTRRRDGLTAGTFALRSPNRPNPIGSAVVKLVGVSGTSVTVLGMDCVDNTPLLDIKPAMLLDLGNGEKA